MKLKNIFKSFGAAAILMMTACSPDDYGFGSAQYTSDQLVAPDAYTVTVEGNRVHLVSNLKDCTPLWITPSGRSQNADYYLDMPFAGDYEVTFGAETRAGAVYGEPYKFTIAQNDFSMLSDEKWEFLAGGVGKTKKWYPIAKDYGVGQTVGPVTYCDPNNVRNDDSNSTDLAFRAWAPNWDPGIQSWLIPADDPYMTSYMEFGLSATDGCTATVFRNDANGGTLMNGKFVLNLDDKTHPVISFNDCYALHSANMDDACANYTQEIKIVELTPYCLQLATMRTNSEGPWWLVWSFVSEEVIATDGACIPKDDPGLLEPTDPELPTITDLATNLFTTEIPGAGMATCTMMSFKLNDEQPYDWQWWNGAKSAWESVTKGQFNETWAPAASGDAVEDFELTFEKTGDNIKYTLGDTEGTCSIGENTITFDKEVTLLTAASDNRTVEVKGKTFTVLKCVAGEEVQFGVPSSNNENGDINSYLVVNLNYKQVGGGQTGPTVVKFTPENVKNYIEADKYFRCQLYNPWGDGINLVDPAAIKVKKNQKLSITVRLNGFTFTKPAKMVLCFNHDGYAEENWEPDCFGYSRAIEVNGDGTYTVSWINDTGATKNWGDGTSALTITMQYAGYASVEADAEGDYKDACTVESIVIE